jgi:hypothetical protein
MTSARADLSVKHVLIAEIAIDEAGRLHVVPLGCAFPLIYREGTEVSWDADRRSLHSPPPRQWSHLQWFEQIRTAARAQGCELQLGADTRWLNVAPNLQAAILQLARTDPRFQ